MRLLSLIFISSACLFGQLTDGIATSVTRSVTLTADQADFSLVAGSALGTTQQDVAAALQEAGIANLTPTGTYLTQTYDYSKQPPATGTLVVYQFTLTVPAGQLAATAKTLEAVRAKPPALFQIFQYAASLSASPATVEAMHQTLLPQFLAEAQKKGQALAAAAGVKLGAVKGMSESSYSSGGGFASFLTSSSTLNVNGTVSSASNGTQGTQYTFYMNVTFGLGQ